MDAVSYEWAKEADLDQLVRAFDGMPRVMAGYILGPCWLRLAEQVVDDARTRIKPGTRDVSTRRLPRRLRDSGFYERRDWHVGGEKVKGAAAIVKFRQPHAHLIEFGHLARNGAHIPARPYLEPALRNAASDFHGTIATLGRKRFVRAIKAIESGRAPASLARSLESDLG